MYSGYLHPTPHDHVHYFLAQSGGDGDANASVPLVLWLNGGPGASSLMGAFTELGPFIMASNTTLMKNPYAWNTIADVLYLESPTGVGFSWCDAMKQGDVCKHTDTSTAELNLASLRQFLDAFPEYKGRDFMIWGESYAGVFIPTLADLVYESDLPLNFLGFGVGDPCTDEKTQHLGDKLHFNVGFAYQSGFISHSLYSQLTGECMSTAKGTGGAVSAPDMSSPDCRTAWRLYYMSSSNDGSLGPASSALPQGGFIEEYNSYGPNNHDFMGMMRAYLNTPEVQDALHVTGRSPFGTWRKHLDYTKQHLACFYEEGVPPSSKPLFNYSMLPFYEKLVGRLRNVVVFNGDTDPCLQMRGTEAAVESLGMDKVWGGDWRPWFYTPEPVEMRVLEEKAPYWGQGLSHKALGPQLAGYVKTYEQGLSFVTVHQSGHMVPQYKPQVALHLFRSLLHNRDLSPLLNMVELESGTDASFFGNSTEDGYMTRWIKQAQSQKYAGGSNLSPSMERVL